MLLVFAGSAFVVNGQNKVYWVHGLLDDGQAWNVYRTTLTAEENRGAQISWVSSFSLQSASEALNWEISEDLNNSGKAIVFGHSAGGLVARDAARKSNKIRAIITAGTPNKGAPVASALASGAFENVANRAVNVVTSALTQGDAAMQMTTLGIGSVIELFMTTGRGALVKDV